MCFGADYLGVISEQIGSGDFDKEEIAAWILKFFASQIWTKSQRIFFDFKNANFMLTVTDMHTDILDWFVTSPHPSPPKKNLNLNFDSCPQQRVQGWNAEQKHNHPFDKGMTVYLLDVLCTYVFSAVYSLVCFVCFRHQGQISIWLAKKSLLALI